MNIIRKLLIVDDNPGDVDLCRIMFEPAGCVREFLSAATGDEALEILKAMRTAPPEVVLLDINMPRMSGFELVAAYEAWRDEHLRPDEPLPAVVMLTSSEQPRERERAASHPLVKGFLVKPPSADDARWLAHEFGSAPAAD